MKGMELPVNTLVIIAIAATVMLVIIAMFAIGINPFKTTVGYDAAKTAGCKLLLQDNCATSPKLIKINNLDVNGDGTICPPDETGAMDTTDPGCTGATGPDTLQALAESNYGVGTGKISETKALCNCPGYY